MSAGSCIVALLKCRLYLFTLHLQYNVTLTTILTSGHLLFVTKTECHSGREPSQTQNMSSWPRCRVTLVLIDHKLNVSLNLSKYNTAINSNSENLFHDRVDLKVKKTTHFKKLKPLNYFSV